MTEVSAAWGEVGSRFTALGQKLRQHFDDARSAESSGEQATASSGDPAAASIAESLDATSEATGTSTGSSTGGTGEATSGGNDAVHDALRKLGDALDAVVDAVTSAVKDPAVKSDVKDMGGALTTAFSRSFAEVSEDLRKAFNRARGSDTPPTDSPPSSS
jgi:hypothetical protein